VLAQELRFRQADLGIAQQIVGELIFETAERLVGDYRRRHVQVGIISPVAAGGVVGAKRGCPRPRIERYCRTIGQELLVQKR